MKRLKAKTNASFQLVIAQTLCTKIANNCKHCPTRNIVIDWLSASEVLRNRYNFFPQNTVNAENDDFTASGTFEKFSLQTRSHITHWNCNLSLGLLGLPRCHGDMCRLERFALFIMPSTSSRV